MHYTGIAAMHVYGTHSAGMLAAMQGGVSAQAFLLPLIIGISLLAFILTVVISLSPTEAEIHEDAALMARISGHPQHARHPAAPQPVRPGYDRAYDPGYSPGSPADAADDSGRWFRPRT